MLTTFNAILVEEANRLDGDLYEKSLHISGWIDLVKSGAMPEGMGDKVSTMIWERTLPGSTPTWKYLMGADNGGASESILPSVATIGTAKTLREYRVEHTALESESFNVNDLRTAVIREEQLGAIRDNLSMNTNKLWQDRARTEYDRLVKHVALVSGGSNVESAIAGSADTTDATAQITNAALTRYRRRVINGGGGRGALAQVNNAPIFGLICDSDVSDALKNETSIAEALKFNGRAGELLTPLGVEGTYKNFAHIIDDVLPRYTYSGGVYTEVLPYTTEAADTANGKFGTRVIENTAYETAQYTKSYFFHPEVMEMLYPNSVSGGAGMTFDPQKYRGEWKWCNVQNMDSASAAYNPDGTIGKFRGVFASATKAIKPEFGFAFIHKRPGF